MNETVVLAFSGGLDTSYCMLALREQGYKVQTVFVDTGGLSQQELEWIRRGGRITRRNRNQVVAGRLEFQSE